MNKIMVYLVVIGLLSGGFFENKAEAAPGDLDESFGVGGKVTELTDPPCDGDTALAIQPDGKILVAGNCFPFGFTVAQYLANGTLDPDFGIGGFTQGVLGEKSVAHSVAVLPDGKILAGGVARIEEDGRNDNDNALVRYLQDGSLDTSFGTGGFITDGLPHADVPFQAADALHQILVLPDGKILAGGVTNAASNDDNVWLGRYHSDGTLDESFGSGGKVISERLGGNNHQPPHPFGIQSDGKIIIIGYITTSTNDFGLERYNNDGTIDLTFGADGLVTTDFGGTTDSNNGVSIQPDDKILVGGESASRLALARYNSDGTLDTGFGFGGLVALQIGDRGSRLHAMIAQPDGKILAAGFGDPRTGEPVQNLDFALIRFNNDGTPDLNFGENGMVFTDLGFRERAYSIAIQNDRKIVLHGESNPNGGSGFFLTRYLGDEEVPQHQFYGFLPPLTADGRTVFKLGSVIPVKFQLFDENSLPVSTAIAHLSLQKISGTEPVGDPIDASSVSNADTGNQFRYSDDQYIYNLDTKPLSSGTWQLRAMLDDGSTHTIQIDLKSK
ncbi:MAG: PxKF domain-containing protein [Candidatus Manganitrophus sp. SB1]|nr:PxKF domain-containing protein [Candidatus Manganitrophus morganii]